MSRSHGTAWVPSGVIWPREGLVTSRPLENYKMNQLHGLGARSTQVTQERKLKICWGPQTSIKCSTRFQPEAKPQCMQVYVASLRNHTKSHIPHATHYSQRSALHSSDPSAHPHSLTSKNAFPCMRSCPLSAMNHQTNILGLHRACILACFLVRTIPTQGFVAPQKTPETPESSYPHQA